MTPASTLLSILLATAPVPDSTPAELTLRINLPEKTLEVVESGDVIRSYPATIGAPKHPTPTGSYTVSAITWNPWWNPPASEWARGKEKTPPGPKNPMGRAKLRFDELLYVHGTVDHKALGTAASHGCIRLANKDVLDLARLIAERTGALDGAEVKALEASPKRTREVVLPGGGVPIYIEYRLVKEVDGRVARFKDDYKVGLRAHEEWLLENGGKAAQEPSAAAAPPPAGLR